MEFRPITNRDESAQAFELFTERFTRGAKVFSDHSIGFQGGGHSCDVFWHDEPGFWGLFEPRIVNGRYWICFGLDNPASSSPLSITVETNPPIEGINRRCAGVFLRNGEGNLYIGHSGKVGGGRKGIGKSAFREYAKNRSWEHVSWPNGDRDYIRVIGALEAASLIKSIGEFVNDVAQFKESVASVALERPNSGSPWESHLSFVGLMRKLLRMHPEGMTPQQIRDLVKADYPEFHGTESHRRNVEKGHYKDIDHALLAQIYAASRTAKQIVVDRAQKPIKLTFATGQNSDYSITKENAGIRNHKRKRSKLTRHLVAEVKPLIPSQSLISEYFGKWEKLENYRLQEASLGLLFRELCPENKAIEHVLLKVSALNDFYSTHIYDTYSVARHIVKKDIDMRLEECDYSLVNEIAIVPIRGTIKNFYSFATKYCSHHKADSFPVFDSFVEKMLLYYKRADAFSKFHKIDLKVYGRFIEIIKGFQKFYGLEKCSLREIDIFLWLAGKEWFPKKYK